MGCAPSAELMNEAPFRPPQGGVRQVALIPIVAQYFPTPDCALFKQLYEAYTDPSVRYYVRSNFDGPNGDLSRIPDVINSREELHALLLQLTSSGMFATNADVRAAYATGEFYRIRPTLCAVVFLYEGANYVPEGSVQLPTHGRGPAVFVKVIGVVGDTTTMLRKASDPPITFTSRHMLKMQTLITKSAGDHNMSRVVLLASYIYYHQCCEVIGLPKIPSMAACFTCFKTNIPFLCFLREMRDRTAAVLEGPRDSKFYIDEYCLHGAVTQEYVEKMMPAFAYYFVSFLNAKTEQRMVKQLAHQQRANLLNKDGASQDSKNASTSLNPSGSGDSAAQHHEKGANVPCDPAEKARVTHVMTLAAKEDATADANNAAPKVTYIVKGYITRPSVTLSAWSCAPNEVYVTCMDSVVTVVDRRSVDAADGPTHTPTLNQADGVEEIEEERGMPASTWAVVESYKVRRGDILSFYTPSSPTSPVVADWNAAGEPSGNNSGPYGSYNDDDSESLSSSQADCLRLNTDDDSARPSPTSQNLPKNGGAKEAPTLRKGSWHVDESIFIESVLLSLVRDECKLAREASVDDPRWVHDDVRNCPVHDGSFYVWHFRRGQENFFYGTVPKFANTNHTQGRGGGASGSRALRNGGVRVNKSGGMMMMMDPHSGAQGVNNSNAAMRMNGGKKSGDVSGLHRGGGGGMAGQPMGGVGAAMQPAAQRYGPPMGAMPFGYPMPATALNTPPQQQQQQQRPPSYVAAHAASTAASNNMNAHLGSGAMAPSGTMYLFPNGSVATGTATGGMAPATGGGAAPGQYIYNVPYMYPGQPAQLAMSPPTTAQTGMPMNAYVPAQGPQPGGPWFPMSGAALSAAGRGMGESVNTSTYSVSTNASSPVNTPVSLPYMMNAQGQLVPMLNATAASSKPAVAQGGPQKGLSTPPAPPAQPLPNYVMVNGQLCTLQPAPGAALTPPHPAPRQQPPTPPQMQYGSEILYRQQ